MQLRSHNACSASLLNRIWQATSTDTESFELVAKAYSGNTWTYWLWLKVTATPWCGKQDNAAALKHKTVVGVTSSTPGSGYVVDAESQGAGDQPATPGGATNNVEIISLEDTFVGWSNLPQVQYVEATVQATSDVAIQYDAAGKVTGTYPTKKYDAVIALGLLKVSQVAHVEIESSGCGPRLGASFTIKARGGIDQDDRFPVSFNYGRGGKPNPRWANGGTIQEADLFQLKYEADPLNPSTKYYLYLHLAGSILSYADCSTRGTGNDFNVVASITSGTGTPLEDVDPGRKSPPAARLGVIPHTSFEMTDRALQRIHPKPIEVKYLANGGDYADNNNSPDPIYVGSYKLSQVVSMLVEVSGCGFNGGVNFHIRPSEGGIYTQGKGMGDHVQAYMFGHALQSHLADRVKLRYVKEGAWAHMWVTVDGYEKPCGSAAEQKQHRVVVVPTVTSAELLQRVPPVPGDGSMPADAEVADVISLKDATDTVTDKDNLLAAANLAANRKIFEVAWNGTVQVVDEPDANTRFTQYVGTYLSQDVIHLDIQDAGCNSNVGLYANVVSRWGMAQEGHCSADRGACGPESFILGSAHPNLVRESVQLYWRPIDDQNGDAKQDIYDLYVGVVEKQCSIPASARTNVAAATEWWKSSWMKGLPPKHKMTISVRTLHPPPRNLQCPPGQSIKINADTKYVCGNAIDLVLKADGSPQSPAGFQRMARVSAEDIVLAAPMPATTWGDIIDWVSKDKAPKFGPRATDNTVLPYEMTLTETINPHAFRRQFHYQYMEVADGVYDPDNLVYGNPKYPALDAATGYLYLGRFQIEQVVQIDMSDKMPMGFGQSFTCIGKPTWGTPKANSASRKPKCFMYGAAVSDLGTKTIIYNMVDADKGKRQVDYWLASASEYWKPAEGRTWRRDLHITTKAMSTGFSPGQYFEGVTPMLWPKWTKIEQSENLALLNEAVDWKNNMDMDVGVVEVLSFEGVNKKMKW